MYYDWFTTSNLERVACEAYFNIIVFAIFTNLTGAYGQYMSFLPVLGNPGHNEDGMFKANAKHEQSPTRRSNEELVNSTCTEQPLSHGVPPPNIAQRQAGGTPRVVEADAVHWRCQVRNLHRSRPVRIDSVPEVY